jgi:hypothetical protein
MPNTREKFVKKDDMDRRGGGLVLECIYVLLVRPVLRDDVISQIKETLSKMDGCETIQGEIEWNSSQQQKSVQAP